MLLERLLTEEVSLVLMISECLAEATWVLHDFLKSVGAVLLAHVDSLA